LTPAACGGLKSAPISRFRGTNPHLSYSMVASIQNEAPFVTHHPEVPLVALFGLMHLGVTFLEQVLGRTRGIDDRRIDNCARRDLDAALAQLRIDRREDFLAEFMPYQQMAEFADGRFVGRAFFSEIDADESPHRNALVQRLFDSGVAQVEPLLQKTYTKHALEIDRRAATFACGIVRSYDFTQGRPWQDAIHLGKERGPARRLRVPLEVHTCKRHLLIRHGAIIADLGI